MLRTGLTSTSTNRKHRTMARTRQTTGLQLLPCPAFLFSNGHPEGAKSGLTAYRRQVLTVAHQGAAGPATQIATQQCARWCQRHPNVAHPTATLRRWQEEGGLRLSEGDGGGGGTEHSSMVFSL